MRLWRFLTLMSVALLVVALSGDAQAQCSMCKAVLSGAKDQGFIRGYNLAVVVLLLPPVTIFCTIFIALKRHSQKGQRDSDQSPDET